MCALGPYTYVSVAWPLWSCYGLSCQCLLGETGICGIQNGSVHPDLSLYEYFTYETD